MTPLTQWLDSYGASAALSDKFRGRPDHVFLLAAGLVGEGGSVIAEMKKMQREGTAYPYYRQRLVEELGDFLWYYIRLASTIFPNLDFIVSIPTIISPPQLNNTAAYLEFGARVGDVLQNINAPPEDLSQRLATLWSTLVSLSTSASVDLAEAARFNLLKTQSRWPLVCEYFPLFDDDCHSEDKLPRILQIEFRERKQTPSNKVQVILRYNGINIGARLTDNITEPDAYRYHDIFHISYAVFLGWSPVTRSLLNCKRKGKPDKDENEDGARAAIVEEAISAIVFSRAKHMRYFDGASQVDYDLLKSIQEFVQGFEVERVPVWQWERAILEGFRIFRLLRDNGPGGIVSWDLLQRRLNWIPPTGQEN